MLCGGVLNAKALQGLRKREPIATRRNPRKPSYLTLKFPSNVAQFFTLLSFASELLHLYK